MVWVVGSDRRTRADKGGAFGFTGLPLEPRVAVAARPGFLGGWTSVDLDPEGAATIVIEEPMVLSLRPMVREEVVVTASAPGSAAARGFGPASSSSGIALSEGTPTLAECRGGGALAAGRMRVVRPQSGDPTARIVPGRRGWLGTVGGVVLLAASSLAAAGQPPAGPPSFAGDVAPILFAHCSACHRDGGIGPFSVLEYEGARERAEEIAAAARDRRMPPWLPASNGEPLAGVRALSEDEIAILRRWAGTGAAEGDPARLPEPPGFTPGWQHGEPDLVVRMPEPFDVPASGGDRFRSFLVPVPTAEDRFVEAMEFRPGPHGVIHHAVVLVDRARSTRYLEALDPEPGWAGMRAGLAESPDGHFVGWTPGKWTVEAPEGMPWRLPRGSDLVLQLHVLPRPDAPSLQVEIGFHFADRPPDRTPVRLRLGSKTIAVPAGESRYRIRDSYRLPVDVELIGLYPHAHYLGRDMEVLAELPSGRRRLLLHIPRWDFDWQDEYRFASPVALPGGTVLRVEFTYDNSAANARNPHAPPRRVVYGPESADEMGDLWIQAVPRRPEDLETLRLDFARKETGARLAGYRFRLDEDPQDEIAHHSLARLLLDGGDRDEGRRLLEEAVRLRPDFAAALNDLGRLELLAGEVDAALSRFREALAASPGLPEAHQNLGAVLLSRGERDAAEAHFREALDGWPDFAEAHYGLGEVLEALGRREEAFLQFRRAVEARPDFGLAHFRLGNLLAARGEADAAIRHFDAALVAEPDLVPALYNRAAVLAREGRREEAVASLRRLLATHPDHPQARSLLERLEALRPKASLPSETPPPG